MSNYNRYHSDIKMCYALGIQNEILPEKFIKEIPNSTSHYWKELDAYQFVGSELVYGIRDNLDDTKVFLDHRLRLGRQAFIQFARLYLTLMNLIGKDHFKILIRDNRTVFVELIENLSDDFPFSKKEVLRFLMISKKQYSSWLHDRKHACEVSLIGQCFRRRPNQISNREINMLKKYMKNPDFKTWCIRSIWGKAFRDGVVSMAESTWYKYARKLGFSQEKKLPKKPRKKGSFNASRPNEMRSIHELKKI